MSDNGRYPTFKLTHDRIQTGDTIRRQGKNEPMKIVKVSAIPMSAPVPVANRHRTDLGTKVKSDATLIRVETDNGLTGIGAALGSPQPGMRKSGLTNG